MALQFEVKPSAVETAIIAQLQADTVLAGLLNSEVASYRLEDHVKLVRVAGRRLPAIAVAYTGGDYERLSHLERIHHAQFAVLVYAQSLRSEEDSRAGAYAILERLPLVLQGEDLGLDMEALEMTQAELISFGDDVARGVAVYQVTFTGQIALVTVADEDDLDRLDGTITLTTEDGPTSASITAQTETSS